MDKRTTNQAVGIGIFTRLEAALQTAVIATIVCCALWGLYTFLPGGDLRNPSGTIAGTLFICFFGWLFMPAACAQTRADASMTGIVRRMLVRPRLNGVLIFFAFGFGWVGHAVFYGNQSSLVHAGLLSLQLTWSYWFPVILGTLVIHKDTTEKPGRKNVN